MNYFDFGKVVEGVYPLPYKGSENPIYRIKWDDLNDVHCVPEMLSNEIIRNDWFFNTIASQSGIGTPFSKNARYWTRIHYTKDAIGIGVDVLRISGHKAYSRRSERIQSRTGIPRRYVSQVLHDRIGWFLKNSPFVESFTSTGSGVNFQFRIKYKKQQSDQAERWAKIRDLKLRKQQLENSLAAAERSVKNYISLDTLIFQRNLIKVRLSETNESLDKLKG
ncbi:hypothetical protein CPT_Muldoon_011 [Serratia phage Muldoon]|uniref:Uncharacterized protein n=1 Tax=Serratia phage Muldoon TaxID=2601678 RepID=A0A5P8PGZ7_9CAUD|nr:hypothetical protein HYP94_gp011 [Serratia phage Muldoon]QFR55968.1 hypothetical protein CPT_Muldoon_011 [Serratia phage Muldoon]